MIVVKVELILFLYMYCTSGQNSGTTATMFQKTDVIIKLELPWKNCVGVSLDNTSGNLVTHNSTSPELYLKIAIATLQDAHLISFTTRCRRFLH